MSIVSITTSRHEIALKEPFVTALRRVETVSFVRVCITDNQGIIGIGEAPPTVAITGEDIKSIESDIHTIITPLFLGKALSPVLFESLHVSGAKSSARAAVDIALHNLLAARHDMSLVHYLGGRHHPLYSAVTVSLGSVTSMCAQASRLFNQGCDLLKIKLGSNDGNDLERIRSIRHILPDAILLVDANQGWSESQTLSMIDAMHSLNITLIEQPVHAHDLKAMERITCKSAIPILADESAFDLDGVMRVYESGAAHMINIKLMKCGGISKAVEILRYCQEHNITCMMGSMLEGPTSIEAAAQLAMCYGDIIRYVDLDSPLLYDDITKAPRLHYQGSMLSLFC